MEEIVKFILIFIGVILLLTVIGGIIVFLIWPIVVPAVFPGLVENGTLAGKIGLFPSFCLIMFVSILIKSSNSNTNKKE